VDALLQKLIIQLQGTLPGEDAQYRMAPLHRQRTVISDLTEDQYKPSAVMIVFCLDSDGEFYIPLIERFSYEGAHSAQVSLPGGKKDAGDVNLMDTARRECYEEIGIGPSITVAGQLTKVFIDVSGFLIEPYVGVCVDKDPVLLPNAREVKSILKLRVRDLLDGSLLKTGTITVREQLLQTPFFLVENRQVWGATAMILAELREVIRPIF